MQRRLLTLFLFSLMACPAQVPPPDRADAGSIADAGTEPVADAGLTADAGARSDAGPAATPVCVADPEHLNGVHHCRLDEHCPCGAHCALGRCIYDCLEGVEDCPSDERCTLYGRCVAAELEEEIPAPDPEPVGRVRLSRQDLLVNDRETVVAIQVRVEGADIPELRIGEGESFRRAEGEEIILEEGTEVNCVDDSDDGFSSQCILEDLVVGSERTLYIRPGQSGAGEANHWMIRVFSPGQVDLVDIELVEPAPIRRAEQPVSGLYSGTVELSDPEGRVVLNLPVTAQVLGGEEQLQIRLHDPLQVLSPSGLLWGENGPLGLATFGFKRVLFAGEPAEGEGDAEVHMFLFGSKEGEDDFNAPIFRGAGQGWLGGRFHVQALGFLPGSEYLACQGQYMCQMGQNMHPCCGRSGGSRTLLGNARTMLQGDIRLFRRGALPDDAEVRRFDELAVESPTNSDDQLDRILWPDAQNPWNAVVDQIFDIEGVNPLFDSRWQAWADLDADSDSVLRCETDNNTVSRFYTCRGDEVQGWAQNYPVCEGGTIAAMQDRCVDYRKQCNRANEPDARCVHHCTRAAQAGFGPGPLPDRPPNMRYWDAAVAERCAQQFFCYEPPAGDAFETEGSNLAQRVLPISGDLTCADPRPGHDDRIPSAIGLFTNADAAEDEVESLDAGAMLAACFNDLAREVPDLNGRGPNWDGADIRRVFQTEGCIDLARFWSSLKWAAVPALHLAVDPEARDPDWGNYGELRVAHGLYLRLMTQWLQLHQFIANEGLQAHRLAKVLRQEGDNISPTEVPDLAQLRGVLSGAWEVFLRPRYVTGLLGVPGDQLRQADYRQVIYPQLQLNPRAYHEQGVGLPVFLVEAMSTYMEVLEAESEEVWATGRQMQRHKEATAKAVRESLLMESLAHLVVERSGVGQGSWYPRYLKARTQLKRVRARVLRLLASLDGNANPLGVDDSDLPLYFRVDDGGNVGRFSVVSRYFLDERSGIATLGVDAAVGALTAARGSWQALREGTLQDRNHTIDAEDRGIATAQQYGQPILEICGAHRGWDRPDDPGDDAPVRSEEAIDWIQSLPTFAHCALDTEQEQCRFDEAALLAQVRPGELDFQLCKAVVYHARYGDDVRFIDDALDDTVSEAYAAMLDGDNERDTIVAAVENLGEAQRQAFFDGMKGMDQVSAWHRDFSARLCGGMFPGVRQRLPNLATMENSPMENSSCYMGSLGEAMFDGLQQKKAMEAAEASINALVDAYDIAVESCYISSEAGAHQEDLVSAHNDTMRSLRTARLVMTAISEVAEIPWYEQIASLGGGAVHAVAATSVQSLSDAMDRAEENHELAKLEWANYYDNLICFNDAKLHLVSLRTAQINMESAALGLQQASQRIRTLVASLDGLSSEGLVARDRVAGWQRPPVAHDQWLDEDVDGFLSAMRRAKRVAYLAVRAAEYEFQMSREERGEILAAAGPGELSESLASLRTVMNTQRINGRSPENFRAIFSLKKHLLQVASRENFPETHYRLNDERRFRALINSQRFALYGGDGEYLGQRIPFSLTPFEGQRNGGEFSLPVVSTSRDCAERVWGVNISLDGEGLVPEGAARQSARVELLQKNSFFSRLCQDGGDAGDYQVQTIRPERNLFRDPLVGAPQGAEAPRVSRFPGWTRARVDAPLNVPAETFNAEDYTQNESTELAARGMYGQYALFFPAQMLRAVSQDGLELRKLDDVRIRVDFVSVAR